MRILFPTLFLLVFSSLSARSNQNPLPPEDLRVTQECAGHLNNLKLTNQTFSYGWLTVPQSETNTRPVHVFYQAQILKDENGLTKKPVIFFNGGPSMDSHNSLITLLSKPAFNQDASLIMFDQRGTGCSSPYPAQPESSDLNDYGSRQIVKDAESLRQHLGINKWTAFGQSYGGLIVQRYVETFPGSLNKAVLHGMPLGSIDADAALRRFEMGVAGLAEFLAESPEMEVKMKTLKELIPEDYCIRSQGFFQLCGPELMDLHVVFTRNLNQQEFQDSFHQWINSLFHLVVTQGHGLEHPNALQYWSNLSSYAIGQNPSKYYWEQVITKQEITPGFADLETGQLFQMDSESLVSEARLFRSFEFENNSFLDVKVDEVSLATVRKNLQSHPDLKMYIFAGEQDVFSPAAVIRAQYEEHLLLDNVTFRSFPNSGHEGYETEPAVIEAVIQ